VEVKGQVLAIDGEEAVSAFTSVRQPCLNQAQKKLIPKSVCTHFPSQTVMLSSTNFDVR